MSDNRRKSNRESAQRYRARKNEAIKTVNETLAYLKIINQKLTWRLKLSSTKIEQLKAKNNELLKKVDVLEEINTPKCAMYDSRIEELADDNKDLRNRLSEYESADQMNNIVSPFITHSN